MTRWRSRTTVQSLLAGLFLFLTLGAWALSSPVGSAPDDTYHLPTIWCSWGESDTCQMGDKDQGYLVPQKIAEICTYQRQQLSAACEYRYTDELVPAGHLAYTGQETSLGGRMPFHVVLRALVGTDAARSAMAIRLFNALLASLMLTWALIVATPPVRRALGIAWAVCLIPVGMFIIPSANPSSWAIIGVGTFWGFLLTWTQEGRLGSKRAGFALAGASTSAAIAICGRVDSVVYLGASVAAVALLAWPQVRASRAKTRALIAASAVAVVAALVTSAGDRLRILAQAISGNSPWEPSAANTQGGISPLVNHLIELPAFLTALVGNQAPTYALPNAYTRGLGWLDTDMPSIVGTFMVSAIAAVIFWGLGNSNGRKFAAITILLVTLFGAVILPLLAMNFTDTITVQPRYYLPALFTIVGVSAIPASTPARPFRRVQTFSLVLIVAFASSGALLANTNRYVLGELVPWMELGKLPSWSLSGLDSTALWVLGSLSGVGLVTALLCAGTRSQEPIGETGIDPQRHRGDFVSA